MYEMISFRIVSLSIEKAGYGEHIISNLISLATLPEDEVWA